jgi:hypothetical protein
MAIVSRLGHLKVYSEMEEEGKGSFREEGRGGYGQGPRRTEVREKTRMSTKKEGSRGKTKG